MLSSFVFGIDWWVQGNGSLVVVPLTRHWLSIY